jgi:hypothetical protein
VHALTRRSSVAGSTPTCSYRNDLLASSPPRFFSSAGEFRFLEQVSDCLLHHFAINNGNGCRQWNVLRADLHTVPGVTALVNSTIAHHCFEPFLSQVGSGRVEIEQPYLIDDRCSNESCGFGKLRADFHAQATGHATRQGISLLLHRRIDARSRPEVVGPIYRAQAFTCFRFSNNTARSTARSLTTGNRDKGSR